VHAVSLQEARRQIVMSISVSAKNRLHFLKQMILIRCFEKRVLDLYAQGRIRGMCHVCIGQEAVATGVCAALRKDDWITSTYRGHGHLLARGADPASMMAELFGKATGCCKGRGGSMHIADVRVGHLGANGIVGANIPIACGAAFTARYKQTDQVALCFFGDGASNQGVFHESLNMAALWRLPVVFVCENNLYAVSTHVSKTCPTPNVADKADAYGIPKKTINGMNVLDVMEVATEAIARAREGSGPTLIECKTYAFQGHGTNNDRFYRTKAEESDWEKKCPIITARAILFKNRPLTEKKYQTLWAEAETIVDRAVEQAAAGPDPEPETVAMCVYAD